MAKSKVEKLAEDIQKLPLVGQAIVGMVLDAKIASDRQEVDVFAWTNNLLQYKEELSAEVFFISKNYFPYSLNISNELQPLIEPLFVDPFLETIFEGAETGMLVRDLDSSNDKSVLPRVQLDTVTNAEFLIKQLEDRDNVEIFSNDSHDINNIKAIAVRFSHKELKQPFYMMRTFGSKGIGRSSSSWQIQGEKVSRLQVDATFKVPVDNQVVIIGQDVYVFNMSKFEKLFNYSYAKLKQADVKAAVFEEHFKISVPSGFVGIQNFLRESPPLLNKFLKTDITLMDQEKVIEASEEMGLDIMVDDAGAIILMDKNDLNKLLDIVNDNYYESHSTGRHYVASSKKIVKEDTRGTLLASGT